MPNKTSKINIRNRMKKRKEQALQVEKESGKVSVDEIRNSVDFRAAALASAFAKTAEEKEIALDMLRFLSKNVDSLKLIEGFSPQKALKLAINNDLNMVHFNLSAKKSEVVNSVKKINEYLVTTGVKFVQYSEEGIQGISDEVKDIIARQLKSASASISAMISTHTKDYIIDTIEKLAPCWSIMPKDRDMDWTVFVEQSGLQRFFEEEDQWQQYLLFTRDEPTGAIQMGRNFSHLSFFPNGHLGDVVAATGALNDAFDNPLVVVNETKETVDTDLGKGEILEADIPSNFLMIKGDRRTSISLASAVKDYKKLDKHYEKVKVEYLKDADSINQQEKLEEAKMTAFSGCCEIAISQLNGLKTGPVDHSVYSSVIELYSANKSSSKDILANSNVVHITGLAEGVKAREKDDSLFLFVIDPTTNLGLIIPEEVLCTLISDTKLEGDELDLSKLRRMVLFPETLSSDLTRFYDIHRALLNILIIEKMETQGLTGNQVLDLLEAMVKYDLSDLTAAYFQSLYEMFENLGYRDSMGMTLAPVGRKKRKSPGALDVDRKVTRRINIKRGKRLPTPTAKKKEQVDMTSLFDGSASDDAIYRVDHSSDEQDQKESLDEGSDSIDSQLDSNSSQSDQEEGSDEKSDQ